MSDAADTIRATLADLGVAETAAAVAQTLHRPAAAAPLVSIPAPAAHTDFVEGREIGRGGMGVVYLAQQRSLKREVAMKVAGSGDMRVTAALVREAAIMGALEHPNVVPVHALGANAQGMPMFVMKRVDGVTWRELIDAPDDDAWKPLLVGHGDKLRAQIDILMLVCRALAFAHDRGVVHRDLKPENVMIGRFGEVYVLDWGVALRLAERDNEPDAIVGTPDYLAPEMARGDAKAVDARADVYLLGATLYEVLTGKMPHEAPTPMQALLKALAGAPPDLPASVPPELAALLRTAMAADKDDRLPSAEQFREGLARFLVSRDADLVARAARAALADAEKIAANEGAASQNAFRALIEARFGFTSALRMRPEDASLRAELERTITRLAERAIDAKSLAAARDFVAELASPPESLLARVAALEAEAEADKRAAEDLAKTKQEADLSKMIGPFTAGIGVLVLFGMAIGGYQAITAVKSGEIGFAPRQAIIADCIYMLVLATAMFIGRRALFSTVASRRIVLLYLAGAAGMGGSDFVTYALGRPTYEAAAHSIEVLCVLILSIAGVVNKKALAALPFALGALFAILAWPRFAPAFTLAAIAIFVALFIYVFRAQAAEARADARR